MAAGRELIGVLARALIERWRLDRGRVGTEHVLLTTANRSRGLRPLRAGISYRVGNPATGWRSADAGADYTLGSDAPEVEAALREAVWWARVRLRRAWNAPAPQWSGGVGAAVGRGLLDAARREQRWANGGHLLVGLCQGAGDRAGETLRDLRVDPDETVRRLARATGMEGLPSWAATDVLALTGALTRPPVPVVLHGVLTALTTVGRMSAARYRLGGYRPFEIAVDREAVRQVVRLDAPMVTQIHLLLALSVLHHQLELVSQLLPVSRRLLVGQRLRPRWAAHNDAGELLQTAGIRWEALADRVARVDAPDQPLPPRSEPWRNRIVADPPFGHGVAEVHQRSRAYATQLGHSHVGTSHLLLALLSGPAAPARTVLQDLGVDVESLAGQVAQRLGLNRAHDGAPAPPERT